MPPGENQVNALRSGRNQFDNYYQWNQPEIHRPLTSSIYHQVIIAAVHCFEALQGFRRLHPGCVLTVPFLIQLFAPKLTGLDMGRRSKASASPWLKFFLSGKTR